VLYLLIFTFIIGVFLGSFLSTALPTSALIFTLSGLLTIAVLFHHEPFVFKLSTCVLLFLLGIWRYQSTLPRADQSWVFSLNDGPKTNLVGQVVTDPERVGNIQKLEAGSLKLENGRALRGKILVRTRRYPEYCYGDEIKISGRLKTPPEFEDFSYRQYLATRGIYSLMDYPEITLLSSKNGNRTYAALINLRHLLEERIGQILPEPESSLLIGVLLGIKRSLPKDFYEALQKSGTLHVVVVSGTNVMYVISGLMWAGGFLARPLRIAFATLALLAYALMVGGGAAVWRATLMGLTVLLAAFLGRRRLVQEAFFLSAATLLAANPLSLWQIGFQLSFAATAGIIFLQDIISSKLQALPSLIRDGLITTLAAQIAVLPVIAYNFQRLSIVSPLTNLLVFPLVPLITLVGAIVALLALVWLPLGRLAAPLVFVPAKFFVTIVKVTSKIPLAQVEMPRVSVWVWVVYYLALVFIVIRCRKKN